ncbi:sensor histidine kinase [Streptomonospora algeriensis]|uniref:histidine kinase n=1 Tax=Streptomonospora algeriensis TaxID=995084 RepID=A0ABW3BE40_9ACTN
MAQDGAAPPSGASTARPEPGWARWWARRHRIADWLLAVAFLPWTALMLIGDPHGLLGLPAMAVAAVAALIGGTAGVFLGLHAGWGALTLGAAVSTVVLFRRTRPRLMFGAATATLLGYGDIGMAALAMFTYAAWYDDRRRLGLWSAWLALCTLVVYTVGGPMTAPAASSMLIMFYGMPLAVGLWIGTRRLLIANLRERAERLEHEQHLLADQAITAERTRIAREMHDVVAHRVSLMVLHAGGLEVSAPDERTAQSAGLIRTTGRDALAELRGILGVLRDEPEESAPTAPQPVLADLPGLVEDWRSAGMSVQSSSAGSPGAPPAQTERTAYRTVQEALTNAAKHAPGAPVRVHLHHRPDSLEITVDNAPQPAGSAADAPPSSGYGLAGLRERIVLAGGEMWAGPLPGGGWRVGATLPVSRSGRGVQEAAE